MNGTDRRSYAARLLELGEHRVGRLIGFAKTLGLIAASWLILGVVAQWVAFGLLSLLPGNRGDWVLYAAGLLLAFAVPLLTLARVRAGGSLAWVWRIVLITSPVFFCGQFIVGGVPDWNPVPLLIGYVLCLTASLATWAISRPGAGSERAALV